MRIYVVRRARILVHELFDSCHALCFRRYSVKDFKGDVQGQLKVHITPTKDFPRKWPVKMKMKATNKNKNPARLSAQTKTTAVAPWPEACHAYSQSAFAGGSGAILALFHLLGFAYTLAVPSITAARHHTW